MTRATFLMTGNALTTGDLRVVLTFPHSQSEWVYSVFLGDMVEAAGVDAWITAGESTPEDAAAIFTQILETIMPFPLDPGDIKYSAAPSLDPETPWLYCDGSVYLRADYPKLFDAIGTLYNTGGESGGQFRVPDLRGEAIVSVDDGRGKITASWAASLAGQGGEENHTLVSGEVPSHSHTDAGHTHTEGVAAPAVGAAIAGVPIPSAVPAVGVTGLGSASLSSSGGGGAHNNLQPGIALYAYIYTGA